MCTTIIDVLAREILDSRGNPLLRLTYYWKTAL